jgi:hypothetical protein
MMKLNSEQRRKRILDMYRIWPRWEVLVGAAIFGGCLGVALGVLSSLSACHILAGISLIVFGVTSFRYLLLRAKAKAPRS